MNEWTIEYYHRSVRKFIDNLPISILADYTRLASMLEKHGADLRLPYSRAMGDGLFELRPKGKEGIARIFYCMMIKQRIVLLHGFIKKTETTPRHELDIAIRRMNEVKNEIKKKCTTSN